MQNHKKVPTSESEKRVQNIILCIDFFSTTRAFGSSLTATVVALEKHDTYITTPIADGSNAI